MVITSPRPGSSGVEQLTRNEQVAGSNPASGSRMSVRRPPRARTSSLEMSVNHAPLSGHSALPVSSEGALSQSAVTARVFVPAYFGPWETDHWAALRSLAPAAVIVNPDNGPGTDEHDGYRSLVANLEGAGTAVFGYVSTDWLRRSVADICADVDRYRVAYGIERVFFDEVANGPRAGRVNMLRALSRPAGPANTVFNCGQVVPQRWYALLPDVRWGTFEGTPEQLAASTFTGPPNRQLHLVHSVTANTRSTVAATLSSRRVAFACVTEDRLPNPWDVCPTPPSRQSVR